MKRIYRRLYCFLIAVIVAGPLLLTAINWVSGRLWGKMLIDEPNLSGVASVPARPQMSLSALTSGQFQTEFEAYFEYKLTARKISTRLYNQLLYSVFHSTDSDSIVVGRENYLYETNYPNVYLTEVPVGFEWALAEKMQELAELHDLLKERGIALVVRMSPTKAEHYPEFLPAAYDRFVEMKRNGEYRLSWYELFKQQIGQTDVPFYDRYDLFQQMKQEGEVVFAKGGTHWTQYPLADYINGLNAYFEQLLGKKLGRVTVTSAENKRGQMGISDDRDIWDICWNALSAEPDYLSPHVTFDAVSGEFAPRVFTVGQSFTPIMLNAIYHNIENPVWSETYFSWYNSYVLQYPNPHNLPWGERITDETNDFAQYLEMDVIMIEFLDTSATPHATQFEFVHNFLEYLKNEG